MKTPKIFYSSLLYIKIVYKFFMNINFKFYILLFSIFFITNLILKPVNANENENRVKEALGFMIGGDGGWESFSTFYEVRGCNVTYHQMFMGFKLIVNYNFNKVFWKSASSEEIEGKTFFTLDGQIGAQSIKAINIETNEDVTNGLLIFGLVGGKTSRIRFPILTDISRFENALIDLSEICQGINTKY